MLERGQEKITSIDEANRLLSDASIISISVPGEYVKYVAKKALLDGLNLFIFSDNVPIDVEFELKKFAQNKGLIVMGPDCGTAIINGVVFGFGNKVNSGRIGVVSAGGTGLQEFTVLVNNFGFGISHAIGIGGRDLKDEIGGISMLKGIELLEGDNNTEILVLISKPPGIKTVDKIFKKLKTLKKKVVVCFLGGDFDKKYREDVISVKTIHDAAEKTVEFLSGKMEKICFDFKHILEKELPKFNRYQKYLRGVFCGGTLCFEAQVVLKDLIGDVYSNVPLNDGYKLKDSFKSYKNSVIDYGEDEFTRGRPHPIIDLSLIKKRIEDESRDNEVAVILFDVILEYSANPDPAGELAGVIQNIRCKLRSKNKHISFIAYICGTDLDPTPLSAQVEKLKNAGVIVCPSNKIAAELAGMIIKVKSGHFSIR